MTHGGMTHPDDVPGRCRPEVSDSMTSPIYLPRRRWIWIAVGYIIFDNDKIRLILAKFHLVEGQDLHNERFHKLGIYHKSLWCFKSFKIFKKFWFLNDDFWNILDEKIFSKNYDGAGNRTRAWVAERCNDDTYTKMPQAIGLVFYRFINRVFDWETRDDQLRTFLMSLLNISLLKPLKTETTIYWPLKNTTNVSCQHWNY